MQKLLRQLGTEAIGHQLLHHSLELTSLSVGDIDEPNAHSGLRPVRAGPDHLAEQLERCFSTRHRKLEEKTSPHWERLLRLDEGSALRDVLGVVGKKGVE